MIPDLIKSVRVNFHKLPTPSPPCVRPMGRRFRWCRPWRFAIPSIRKYHPPRPMSSQPRPVPALQTGVQPLAAPWFVRSAGHGLALSSFRTPRNRAVDLPQKSRQAFPLTMGSHMPATSQPQVHLLLYPFEDFQVDQWRGQPSDLDPLCPGHIYLHRARP